jgi:DNA-directed RNA polymerase specialized sigma24 family protein
MSWSRATITPEGQESQTPPATAPDDAVLVAAAQVDPTAFAPLYARYLPPVYRYCYRRLGTSAAAEDATSEIFVKVLAALPRYRAVSFRSWLFTIAHHVITDILRRRRPLEPLEAADDPVDTALTRRTWPSPLRATGRSWPACRLTSGVLSSYGSPA